MLVPHHEDQSQGSSTPSPFFLAPHYYFGLLDNRGPPSAMRPRGRRSKSRSVWENLPTACTCGCWRQQPTRKGFRGPQENDKLWREKYEAEGTSKRRELRRSWSTNSSLRDHGDTNDIPSPPLHSSSLFLSILLRFAWSMLDAAERLVYFPMHHLDIFD